jgi:hypothetical protein
VWDDAFTRSDGIYRAQFYEGMHCADFQCRQKKRYEYGNGSSFIEQHEGLLAVQVVCPHHLLITTPCWGLYCAINDI